MRIYVELPFSPRNSRYSSPSLSLSLFSLCPSLSRSPANRARNDSLRIFEISLFRNLSSLNISIPSKYYYVLSRRRISRLSIWKKREGGRNYPSFSLLLSFLREREIKIETKENEWEKNLTNRSFLSRTNSISPRSMIFLSFFPPSRNSS